MTHTEEHILKLVHTPDTRDRQDTQDINAYQLTFIQRV